MKFSEELLLVTACCRWPRSAERLAAIRADAATVTDWRRFLGLVVRHRVEGHVHDGLAAAGVAAPDFVRDHLANVAGRIERQNLVYAITSLHIQQMFGAADIPAVLCKGASLAMLAYDTLAFKASKDIDLLVLPDHAERAWRLLENAGYVLRVPSYRLGDRQRKAVLRYGRELVFLHPQLSVQVELHWHLIANPYLLGNVDALSPTQAVPLNRNSAIATLSDENLIPYLFVHGATHGWRRLKWLADVNALLAKRSESEIAGIYRDAAKTGADICVAQGMLLCHALFGLHLPAGLHGEWTASRRLRILAAAASAVIAGSASRPDDDNWPAGWFVIHNTNPLLGHGIRSFVIQYTIEHTDIDDVVSFPLPKPFHFIYVVTYFLKRLFRLPKALWRGIFGGPGGRMRFSS
jgi:hypothetical protein